VRVLGKLDVPHTYTYVSDFGKGLVLLGAHDEALGQSWHIPNAPTLSTRQMLTLFFEEAHLPPRMGSVPDLLVKTLGLFNPLLREVAEMLYEFNEPFVVESSKFVQAFGDIATPHSEAVRRTLEWYRRRAHTQAEQQPTLRSKHSARKTHVTTNSTPCLSCQEFNVWHTLQYRLSKRNGEHENQRTYR
jgi:nucleoside-diphosphate-sugar epimerase